ncbi:hypothetical protein EJ05DRAFT_500321 [Pseudovirgaria hyperparasitica]|uniref:Uncharacterized protein n=1 Tax=Pseudovirgaria hyperparasitica TaxID=470096 RepID=A0A6A6W9U9_9PEZI|nr:uncharacterized protein EJ05DRAFT_500321 [Pseudovirgaria hyperparasitica]KAF2758804.1 hypothetical protein EJ05DRAFT_500321 [Pseudovirgaria hyperparasitica]
MFVAPRINRPRTNSRMQTLGVVYLSASQIITSALGIHFGKYPTVVMHSPGVVVLLGLGRISAVDIAVRAVTLRMAVIGILAAPASRCYTPRTNFQRWLTTLSMEDSSIVSPLDCNDEHFAVLLTQATAESSHLLKGN